MTARIKGILFGLALFPVSALAEFSQTEFVLGAVYDPQWGGSAARYKARLADYKDAGFNLLMNSNTDRAGSEHRIREKLDAAASLGLKMMIAEDRIIDPSFPCLDTAGNPGAEASQVVKETRALSPARRKAVLGYLVFDEPIPNTANHARVEKCQDFLAAADTSKAAFVNLLPFANVDACGASGRERCWADESRYRAYIARFVSRKSVRVVGFDYYPFNGANGDCSVNGWNNYCHGRLPTGYFRNLEIVAEETGKTGKGFWAYPMSIRHGSRGSFANSYVRITEANLKFMAHAPLIYGAKGLIYFTYAPPTDVSGKRLCGPASECYENAGFVDTAYKRMDSANAPQNPIYSWGKAINGNIAKMGPILMLLDRLGTVHAAARDFDSKEERLPALGASTPVLKSVTAGPSGGNHWYAMGIFKHRSSLDPYLLIFNKDRFSRHTLSGIEVEGKVVPKRFLKPAGVWRELPHAYDRVADRTRITLGFPISPAEVELLWLRR